MASAVATEGPTPLKRAFLALEDAEARLAAVEHAAREPVAVIGLGCRMPGGVEDPDGLWRLMQDGIDATAPVPAHRWDHDALYDPDPATPGRIATRRGAFVDVVDTFDAGFFGIAPREADGMDPQQRLFLETSWRALEHAGQAHDRLQDSATGVYVGVCSSDYAYLQLKSGDPALLGAHFTSGIAHSVFSGRLSYLLGLRGPSLTIDTACSSSLVAIHLACQALRGRECRMAIAGGVQLMLASDLFIALSHARMLAPDGRCKTFDAAADGFSRGEGCGVVVLKRLSDAQADGDRILALIRGSAVNQDGPSSSLTAPNGPAQEAVIRAALAFAGVAPHQVGFIEAHGTGTQLGDPLEVAALGAVFGQGRSGEQKLMLGSVKTNIGHLEAAAGVAGLIKVVLALQHRTIPPHLHFNTPSPHIAWSDLPLAVPTQPVAWQPIGGRRIAGVSSFGFSGTNAHAIVEEAPRPDVADDKTRVLPQLFAMSARDPDALEDLAGRYADALAQVGDADLADICRTANTGRSHFSERAAIVADSVDALRSGLQSLARGIAADRVSRSRVLLRDPPRIAFLFTGQGAQYAGMARGLYDTAPVFREALERCANLLASHLDRPLLEVLFAEGPAARGLDQTIYTQPALFAVEYALTELWRSWGVVPSVVMGHSVGEYVAACVAGVFSLEDAVRLIALRGRLMQDLPAGGAMAAVAAPEDAVARAIAPHAATVSIAAVNGSHQTVISGNGADIAALCQTFAQQGLRTQQIPVSHAFHSPLVEPVLDRFEKALESVRFATPRIRLVSNVTGKMASPCAITQAAYWRRHMREAVRFGDGLRTLQAARPDCCIEIGPNPTLLALAGAVFDPAATKLIASLRRGQSDWQQMLSALSAVYLAGAPIHWPALFDAKVHRIVDLPGYPFRRERHWFSARPRPAAGIPHSNAHPLLGARLRTAFAGTIYEARIAADTPDFVGQHRMLDRTILPATAYLVMLEAGARDVLGNEAVCIEDVVIGKAMVLADDDAPRLVQTIFDAAADGTTAVSISSMTDAGSDTANWTRHVTARVRVADPIVPIVETLAAVQARCAAPVAIDAFYARIAGRGAQFGEAFHTVGRLWHSGTEALGEVALTPALASEASHYPLHPVLLDGCLQVIAAALPTGEADDVLYLPIDIGACTIHGAAGAACWSHVTVRQLAGGICRADVRVFDVDGVPVADLRQVQLRQVARDALQRAGEHDLDQCLYEVIWPLAERTGHAGSTPRDWLIFADRAGMAEGLAVRRQAQGDRCIMVRPGRFGRNELGFSIDPSSADDYRRLFMHVREGGGTIDGVIHAWSLDNAGWEGMSDADLAEAQSFSAVSSLLLAQAMIGEPRPPRLWLITRGGQLVDANDRGASPTQATAWGLARTIGIEHPELRCVCVDLDPESRSGDHEAVAAELDESGTENQVALRGSARRVARLVGASRVEAKTGGKQEPADWRLVPATPGTFAQFKRTPLDHRRPGPGEVEIAVEATGLNFKDVLHVLQMRPGDNIPLGGECAGVVTAIGPDVTHLQQGDAVMAVAWGCLASRVTTNAAFVQRRPAGMSAEEAAGFPVAFLTAEFCLSHVGGIRTGQRILIHAGAGGVGMAAIRLAQLAGAEVFATAGSEWKRALLRSIGVTHVFDSRSTSFADAVMSVTAGRGVDIVLNVLAGELMDASFGVLASGGHLIELGKRDLKSASWVAGLGRDLRYTIVDWSKDAAENPSLIGGMLARLVERLRRGELTTLPRHVYKADDAPRAFRLMAQARHVGKVVISNRDVVPQVVRRDGTYLVTGGLSGLGLSTAQWLARRGAGRLILIGRRAATPQAMQRIEALRAEGTPVVAEAVDVTDRAALDDLLTRMRASGPPMRGVIHAAGVLNDAALMRQTADNLLGALAPKLRGAWLLDRLTRVDPLDWFVSFSSIAGVLGSAGQAGYAAANAALDQFAHERRDRGLCALTIDWGAWAEVGTAAAGGLAERHAARGLGTLAPAEAFASLERALGRNAAQSCILRMDWQRYAGRGALALLADLRGPATRKPAGAAERGRNVEDLRQQLAAAPAGRHNALVAAFLTDHALRILGIDPAKPIDPQTPLGDLGLDSLLAVELRNVLATALGESLPSTLLFEYPTIDALTQFLLIDVLNATGAESTSDSPASIDEVDDTAGPLPDFLGAIEGLSDDEVDRMFAARMRASG
jgi:acyl transferase domain-containing protein/NADPH:quinone reductase-like Zn-dependent oxidoreductase/acyl carrier protein